MSIFESDEDKVKNITVEDQEVIDGMQKWFALSLVSILFCGFAGIVATVYAFMANSAIKKDDYLDAVYYAKRARIFAIIGLALGGIIIFSKLINMTAGVE